jgi:hypothetical protein
MSSTDVGDVPTPVISDPPDTEETPAATPLDNATSTRLLEPLQYKSSAKFSISDITPSPLGLHRPSLMAPVKPITLRVYTCDNDHFESIEFETGRHTTAADVSLAMMSRLNISPDLKDVFSIWLLSPYLQLQLKSYHVPVKLFKKWREFLSQYTAASYDVCVSDLPILSFRRNAFLSLREEKRLLTKRDSRKALNLLYHEALHHVISGRYPLQREELVELASIQCAIEHKQFDEETHTANFFKDKLKLYFPAHLTSNTTRRRSIFFGGKNKFNNLEQDLSDGYKDICKKCNESSSNRLAKTVDVETSAIACSLGKDEEIKLWQDTDLQLKLLYLQRCWNKPYYGCVMFRGQVERKTLNLLTYSDRNIIVAINPECIHLFTDENKRVSVGCPTVLDTIMKSK